MNQFIQLLGETFTVLCCGEDWHPRLDEEFVCPKCGRKSEPLPLMAAFPNAQRNYFYALGQGGWSVNRKDNRVLCQACWIKAYAEQNGIELPHNTVTSTSMKEEKEEE